VPLWIKLDEFPIDLDRFLEPMVELFDSTTIPALLQKWGYGLVFVAMLLENAGLPLPGETITLLGGYAAGSGQLNFM